MFNGNRQRDRQLKIGADSFGGSTDSVLSTMFQRIISQCGIQAMQFNRLLDQFVNDPRNAIPQNIKERSSARGNLRKELLKPVMSWKVFCKGLRFINIRQFKLTIQIQHASGKVTLHEHKVALQDLDMNEPDPFMDFTNAK